MNNYQSLRKQNTSRLGLAGALALCVLLTGTVLFSRLAGFVQESNRLYIPLTQSRGLTTVQVQPLNQVRGVPFPATLTPPAAPAEDGISIVSLTASANPGFEVTDKDCVWSGQTSIEIFKITYHNGEGHVTVNSENGDKLLAPGTENTYNFALENTGNVNLQYTMQMEAWFSHEEYPIPIYARLTDHQGNYLVGSAEESVDVLELNRISQAGTISAGYIMPYSLHWEWPFEIDDEYDTMLGNMAVDEDITLTIVIRTTASWTDDEGGITPPQTGDDSQILLLTGIMVASLLCMILLFMTGDRKKEEPDG